MQLFKTKFSFALQQQNNHNPQAHKNILKTINLLVVRSYVYLLLQKNNLKYHNM